MHPTADLGSASAKVAAMPESYATVKRTLRGKSAYFDISDELAADIEGCAEVC
eukprot:SAG11_NODE_1370_length_5096_cov_2.366620_6_plen_53_part_00